MRIYTVNEVFYSIQGEGMRAGTANVFVRFTGCNMKCDLEEGKASPGGFACDTEFASGRQVSIDDLLNWIDAEMSVSGADIRSGKPWVILTGGEPGLQVDDALLVALHKAGHQVAIETNGSVKLPCDGLDWICVSPKVAEHALKQLIAHEVKYVRGWGQGIPKTLVNAKYKLISPAFEGGLLPKRTLEWCIKLVKENPEWRLSVQQHKGWVVR